MPDLLPERTLNMQVKKGDILSGSWGYSMTLWSFYRVEKVTPKQVVLAELKSNTLGGQMWHLKVEPSDIVDTREPLVRVKNDPNRDYIWIPGKRIILHQYDPNKECFEDHMD